MGSRSGRSLCPEAPVPGAEQSSIAEILKHGEIKIKRLIAVYKMEAMMT